MMREKDYIETYNKLIHVDDITELYVRGLAKKDYIAKKIKSYQTRIDEIKNILLEDITTRKCVLQFSMKVEPINCMSQIHILLTDKEEFLITCTMRSSLDEMFDTDMHLVKEISDYILEYYDTPRRYCIFINNFHKLKKR